MFQSDRKNFTYSPEGITADASDVGLAPGQWPDFIAITDEKGSGFLVRLARLEKADGDVIYASYQRQTGSLPEVRIYND